jgi:hypothetical protein
LLGFTADDAPLREPGRLDEAPLWACPSCDAALFARVLTRNALGAGAGVIISCFASRVGVGSRFAGNRCGYGPAMLIERFADAEPFVPIWTTLGGVAPLDPSLPTFGELLRMIFMPGALLGVSLPALLTVIDLLKRIGSCPASCLGGDDGTGASSRSACVTLENLIAGGGSSSESLSPISMRFNMSASAENPYTPLDTERGEFRRICGRVGCATAAMICFILLPMRCLLLPMYCVSPSSPKRAQCVKESGPNLESW